MCFYIVFLTGIHFVTTFTLHFRKNVNLRATSCVLRPPVEASGLGLDDSASRWLTGAGARPKRKRRAGLTAHQVLQFKKKLMTNLWSHPDAAVLKKLRKGTQLKCANLVSLPGWSTWWFWSRKQQTHWGPTGGGCPGDWKQEKKQKQCGWCWKKFYFNGQKSSKGWGIFCPGVIMS